MRGHQSAYRLNQRRTERRAFFIQAALGFPLNTPPPRDERSLTVRGPVRGSPRRARSFGDCLSSRAGSAVPRDAKRNPVNKLFLYVLTFNMQITHRCPTMLPPRGHQSAYRLNQRRTERRAFFIQAALGFPLNTPLPTRCAHSPFATLFCSAPPLGRGSGHALSKSFASFCASRNARVPLRYASQPFRRKIYTKSFAQCFVITFI